MLQYDLHTHSTSSDGSLSPEQLVQRALEKNIHYLALTDHDGTSGITQAVEAAKGTQLSIIPGVEVSVTWANTTIHIVGLNIDPESSQLNDGLNELRRYRYNRAESIANKLEKVGILGALEGAKQFASDELVGRVHFGHFLIEAGHAKDMRDVFKRFLVKNKPGYVQSEWTSLQQAVEWIVNAGGQAVIAHPTRYKMTSTKRRKLVQQFKDYGGAAIEVSSGWQAPNEVDVMAKLANDFGLLASCGSDFHAVSDWSDLALFRPLPSSVTPVWEAW